MTQTRKTAKKRAQPSKKTAKGKKSSWNRYIPRGKQLLVIAAAGALIASFITGKLVWERAPGSTPELEFNDLDTIIDSLRRNPQDWQSRSNRSNRSNRWDHPESCEGCSRIMPGIQFPGKNTLADPGAGHLWKKIIEMNESQLKIFQSCTDALSSPVTRGRIGECVRQATDPGSLGNWASNWNELEEAQRRQWLQDAIAAARSKNANAKANTDRQGSQPQ